MADRTNKEIKTGRFIATASIVFSILLIIHLCGGLCLQFMYQIVCLR